MKRIIIDLDGTLTHEEPEAAYPAKRPRVDVVKKLEFYREQGFQITILTARNMRTYSGNVGLINIHTLPKIIEWLNTHRIPFDEVLVGKPWCGEEGFYVDDRALRPDEFVALEPDQIATLLGKGKD